MLQFNQSNFNNYEDYYMKQNSGSNKTIFITLIIIIFAWLSFLTYKTYHFHRLEQENSKAGGETSVRLIGEINKINQKLEKEAETQAE